MDYMTRFLMEARNADMINCVTIASKMFLAKRLTEQEYCSCLAWCFVDDHALDFIDEGTLTTLANRLTEGKQ